VLCVGVIADRVAGAVYPNQRHRGRRWAKAAVPTNPAARQVNRNDSTHLALVGIGSCCVKPAPHRCKKISKEFPPEAALIAKPRASGARSLRAIAQLP
jgi:hypothetical protein